MPPKAKLQAPIDRPLSRAYLRQFLGWSTAYPPGMSQPNSLRVMENVMVNREASVRVRPGLRYLTYKQGTGKGLPEVVGTGFTVVGSHEVFFLNDGRKAYLFAVRKPGVGVSFRVAISVEDTARPFYVTGINDADVGFGSLPSYFTDGTTYVKYLQIDNKIIALSNNGELPIIFYVGTNKAMKRPASIDYPTFSNLQKPLVRHPSPGAIIDPGINNPLTHASDRTTKTLLPTWTELDDNSKSWYNIGYFYTFSNEFGESAASGVTVYKIRRPWSAWKWEKSATGTATVPSGEETEDPLKSCDQLFVFPAAAAFNPAKAAGATAINFYVVMWSDQEPVPVEGQLVGVRPITSGLVAEDAWIRHTPQQYASARAAQLPTANNRYNYSDPSTAMNGIVAADKLVLVGDPNKAGVIKWTSSRVGEYLNFSANMGGGYKTLTSGNLYVPVSVKLWQNPQSADTLTILCQGVDGLSTAYYMAPAQIASQSDATNIMGFEETTATPGTVAPFGCEVVNNSLFHPMEDALIKSTASNYNINHKNMTDLIASDWKQLDDKTHIVSSFLDARIYYLVYNPQGAALEPGCWGNEVWVLDTMAKDAGTWSRWLVQGNSLRKVEVRGKLLMSISKPDGIYAFDEDRHYDEYLDLGSNNVVQRPIPWKFETNTQGANRAHDAWAHLQQLTLTLGNFKGIVRWGVRGFDINGRKIVRAKNTVSELDEPADGLPWDVDDHLRVARDMKEWRFFAESVPNPDSPTETLPSQGQVSLVMYRYVPVTVNVGYEYGSVETLEYGSGLSLTEPYPNGVPEPMVDRGQP